MSADTSVRRGIPDATVARLPDYLSALTGLGRKGIGTVSSLELAVATGVTSAQLRKDLSFLGSHGVRGVGYDVHRLADEIGRRLGLTQDWPVVIVGLGRLGQAVARYPGLAERGLHVRALLDADSQLVGRQVGALTIRDVAELSQVVAGLGAFIGVITTPAAVAQEICDRLVAAGARSILTFAPGALTVSAPVRVRRLDVATELQILAFHAQPPGVSTDPQGTARADGPPAATVVDPTAVDPAVVDPAEVPS